MALSRVDSVPGARIAEELPISTYEFQTLLTSVPGTHESALTENLNHRLKSATHTDLEIAVPTRDSCQRYEEENISKGCCDASSSLVPSHTDVRFGLVTSKRNDKANSSPVRRYHDSLALMILILLGLHLADDTILCRADSSSWTHQDKPSYAISPLMAPWS